MAPVHKRVVDRAVCGVGGEVLKGRGQEGREVRRGHFTAAHCKIAVLNLALAANVTVYANVVWRVRKYHSCLGVAEQGAVANAVEGIATEQAVIAEPPEVVRLADSRTDYRNIVVRVTVGFCFRRHIQNDVDFWNLKTG